MKTQKNAEFIHALAEGAKLQFAHVDGKCNGTWFTVNKQKINIFDRDDLVFRIDPKCGYAVEKVRLCFGNDVAELYRYWVAGGKLQSLEPEENVGGFVLVTDGWQDYFPIEACRNPLQTFLNSCNSGERFCKKKTLVKEVLWVKESAELANAKTGQQTATMALWLEVDKSSDALHCEVVQARNGWFKVASRTREVEK